MKTYKKLFLFIFIFLAIFFIKDNVYALTLDSSYFEGLEGSATIPSLNLSTTTNSFIISFNAQEGKVRVLEPYNDKDYLVSKVSSSLGTGTYNVISGYSISSSSLTDVYYYDIVYSNGSWTSWSKNSIAQVSGSAPGNETYEAIYKSNIALYSSKLGIIGRNVLSSGVALPDNIKLTDNITIFKHSLYDNTGIYLLHSLNIGDKFKLGTEFTCLTSSGSNAYFDVYLYNSSTNTFEFKRNTNNFNTGLAVGNEYYYSTNDIYSGDNLLQYSSDNFFNFYYENNEYIFPYIADTDEVLSNLDEIEDIIVFPGDITKSQLPMVFSIYDNTNEIQIYSINLDTNSPFYLYIVENPHDYWFEINTSEFKKSLVNGNEYLFNIYAHNDVNEFNITRSITYGGTTFVPPTDEDIQTDAIINQTQKIEEQTNAIINQTEKIEEQTEVQKNIFERIGDILSYINPLSENFFAYKLIDLLIDALKSLFVPEERIFRCIF